MIGRRTIIRTQSIASEGSSKTAELTKALLDTHLSPKRAKNTPKAQAVGIYAGIFILIISMVAVGYRAPQGGGQVATTASVSEETPQSAEKASVDQLVASTVATNLAETVNLPVAGNLRESSTSLYIKSQLAQNDTEIISKPQIVQPTANGRDLLEYTAKAGDTVDAVAAQYGITGQTLRWANNLSSDALDDGKKLTVPQVDGVVYTAKDGDSIQSLAEKYKADPARITLYNDLEQASLVKDMRIVIPGGELPENERPGYVAPTRASNSSYSTGSSFNISTGYSNASVGNRYAFGNCTWYVYERRQAMGRPIGSFWGNGSMWKYSAQAAGYTVNKTPLPGSIFQTAEGGGGYGHVAIVDSVDGAGNIVLSEMNYAGFNVISSRSISASDIQNRGYWFIH